MADQDSHSNRNPKEKARGSVFLKPVVGAPGMASEAPGLLFSATPGGTGLVLDAECLERAGVSNNWEGSFGASLSSVP